MTHKTYLEPYRELERLLDHIVPDRVHVLSDGRIVRSGDKDLARQLEDQGYDWVREEAATA